MENNKPNTYYRVSGMQVDKRRWRSPGFNWHPTIAKALRTAILSRKEYIKALKEEIAQLEKLLKKETR